MKRFLGMIIIAFSWQFTLAQDPAKKLPAELVDFFAGKWQGEGKFASGKIIKANLVYTLSLDSCWLTAIHEDLAPNKYKAMLVWGIDAPTGKFVAYNFDNFQGHRQFISEGFHGQKLQLTNAPQYGLNKVWEHFIYEKLTNSTFVMTYETSVDGVSWKKIDSLVFYRQAAN